MLALIAPDSQTVRILRQSDDPVEEAAPISGNVASR